MNITFINIIETGGEWPLMRCKLSLVYRVFMKKYQNYFALVAYCTKVMSLSLKRSN